MGKRKEEVQLECTLYCNINIEKYTLYIIILHYQNRDNPAKIGMVGHSDSFTFYPEVRTVCMSSDPPPQIDIKF